MSDEKVVRYQGKDSVVSWNGALCIHIGECGRAQGDLFTGGRQPWCDPDLAGNEEINDVVRRCPTGALAVESGDEGDTEQPDPENTIQVAYNGPLYLRGDLDIEPAPADAPAVRFRAALCRCGQSKNKPYCDNSHETANFRDYGAVGESGEAAFEAGGSLQVRLAKDGPLLIKGNVSLSAASGRRAWQGKQVALCRCGASANKPFCDGKHKSIGFQSD